jgi:hypothetical protein
MARLPMMSGHITPWLTQLGTKVADAPAQAQPTAAEQILR